MTAGKVTGSVREFVFKIAIGGKGGVGKTTFINRYVTNEFTSDTKMTIGVQFHIKDVEVMFEGNPVNVKTVLWDLGGQQRFRFVLPSYLRGTAAALIMFDMSRFESLVETDEWLALFRDHVKPDDPIFLVGTKMDVISEDESLEIQERAIAHATSRGYSAYGFTSSASGTNVNEVMTFMIASLLERSEPEAID